MRMLIQVQQPIPAWVNQSYDPFGFYKFGCCCWQYEDPAGIIGGGFDGAVEWINTMNFCTEPKYPSPVAFRYWFQTGVTAIVTPRIQVTQLAPDMIINGEAFNAVTGTGMPLLFAP